MNLKESFRYQKVLDYTLQVAYSNISDRTHALNFKKTHLYSSTNPEAENKVEEVLTENFFQSDDVISFVEFLIDEKEKLSCAITKAKLASGIDIDALIESNKQRQNLSNSIKTMLKNTASLREEKGYGVKFNVEGNQVKYEYPVLVESIEAFDREKSKAVQRKVIGNADSISAMIDSAMINTVVEYKEPFTANDSFEDAISIFLAK